MTGIEPKIDNHPTNGYTPELDDWYASYLQTCRPVGLDRFRSAVGRMPSIERKRLGEALRVGPAGLLQLTMWGARGFMPYAEAELDNMTWAERVLPLVDNEEYAILAREHPRVPLERPRATPRPTCEELYDLYLHACKPLDRSHFRAALERLPGDVRDTYRTTVACDVQERHDHSPNEDSTLFARAIQGIMGIEEPARMANSDLRHLPGDAYLILKKYRRLHLRDR
jgi:hypothetical protein